MNPQSARSRRARRVKAPDYQPLPTAEHPAHEERPHPPEPRLPDPWLYDTAALIDDLDYIRELVHRIPLRGIVAELPRETVVEAIWALRERLWELTGLHREIQRDWVKRGHKAKAPAAATPTQAARKVASIRGASAA